ncbi:MAG: nitrate ABC transporter, permease protein, partial [Mesorhizobium sp.]
MLKELFAKMSIQAIEDAKVKAFPTPAKPAEVIA